MSSLTTYFISFLCVMNSMICKSTWVAVCWHECTQLDISTYLKVCRAASLRLMWLSLQIWRSSIMLFFNIAPNMKKFWTPVLDSQPCSPSLPGLVLAPLIFPPVGAWLLFIYYHEKVLCVNSRLVLKTIAFSFLANGWAIFGIIVIEFPLLSILFCSQMLTNTTKDLKKILCLILSGMFA